MLVRCDSNSHLGMQWTRRFFLVSLSARMVQRSVHRKTRMKSSVDLPNTPLDTSPHAESDAAASEKDAASTTLHAVHSTNADSAVAQEPCPSPLAWQDVLHEFHRSSRFWTFNRDGHTITGRAWGEGPPLYFLNGMAGSFELYALLVWLLREQFCCVVFNYADPIGSAARRRQRSVDQLADDLFAVAEHHGHDRFRLYATSFGGIVGLTAMLKQSARVEQAVIQGGFAHRSLSLTERLLIRVGRRSPGRLKHVPGHVAFQQHNHQRWFPPFDDSRWEFLGARHG